ncbi:hypothetical protein CVT25_000685 [Psilocybe cyanescens]|uniref:Uncharacterized protein n=1 Tax=Psilocybe cyanescens TaxID=93625 RepID=A0A409XUI4_PSICY|nr:hypothetical protein CVT25_000685 [Psilocybe cyanescens]
MRPELAPVAFISAFSLILAIPWHWRTGNVATLSIIAWLFITNMIYAIDAVIWAGNVSIVATVWCDISTKLIIGANFALPAACLCICIHLEQVSSVRTARFNISDKRRRQYFEAFMCIGFPLIIMALHYIIQGHRFDIIEDYGCRPATYFSIPAIFIVWLPPILSALGALVFASLALRHFMMRRLSFAAHLRASDSALTTSRYLRLMAMASLEIFWVIGVTAYSLWFTVIAIPIRPWTTWSDVHSDFLRIDQYQAALTPPIVAKTFYILWWLVPVSTFLFVGFFSFGKDAMDEYNKCFSFIGTHILRRPPTPDALKGSLGKFGFLKLVLISLSRVEAYHYCRKQHSLPTHNLSSQSGTSLTVLSLSSQEPLSPSSIYKSRSMYDSENDTTPNSDHDLPAYQSPYYIGKAVGSTSELSYPPTPSSVTPIQNSVMMHLERVIPLSRPSPIIPPLPSRRTPACDDGHKTPTSSLRPFTYPSFDVAHQKVDVFATEELLALIATRLTVGISVAIPAASLCINRRLYKIASCQAATITYAQKRRAILIDLAIGLGIPALQMILQFIVQGHRYDIWEDIGCLPTTVNTPPAYPLSYIWPNVISLISAVYCSLTLRAFMLRRAQFTQFLSSNTSLTVNRYFRLMCLATTEILFTIPISSYGVYLNAVNMPIYPWKSWADTHFDFYTLDIYPAAIWRTNRLFTIALEMNRWSAIFCAFVFFGFFGFADEALKNYRRVYWIVAGYVGYKPQHNPSGFAIYLLRLVLVLIFTPSSKNLILPLKTTPATFPSSVQYKLDPPNAGRDSFHSLSSSDYTETLHMSPDTLASKFDKFDHFIKTSEPSRLSRMTI